MMNSVRLYRLLVARYGYLGWSVSHYFFYHIANAAPERFPPLYGPQPLHYYAGLVRLDSLLLSLFSKMGSFDLYLLMQAAGLQSMYRQDGHGTVDSGHACLNGYNEAIMLRRLPEEHKINAAGWCQRCRKLGHRVTRLRCALPAAPR